MFDNVLKKLGQSMERAEQERVDAWLGNASDLADLEQRMRHLEQNGSPTSERSLLSLRTDKPSRRAKSPTSNSGTAGSWTEKWYAFGYRGGLSVKA